VISDQKRKEIMYDYKTEIPALLIDEEELSDLVGRLTKHMGAESHIETIYVVSVDDVEISGMLETFADMLIRNKKPKKLEGRVARKVKSQPAEKKLGLHSYVIEETGEVISAQALNKRVANHDIARGTRLTNGRGEKFEVAQGPEEGKFVVAKVAEGEQA